MAVLTAPSKLETAGRPELPAGTESCMRMGQGQHPPFWVARGPCIPDNREQRDKIGEYEFVLAGYAGASSRCWYPLWRNMALGRLS